MAWVACVSVAAVWGSEDRCKGSGESWGWGTMLLVKGYEMGLKIKDLMANDLLRGQAKRIEEEARKAFGVGGSFERTFTELIDRWKCNNSTQ